jgi:hypothetical protein
LPEKSFKERVMRRMRLQMVLSSILGALLFAGSQLASAQTWGDGYYHEGMHELCWGGNLPVVAVSGTAIVDTTASPVYGAHQHAMWTYFLDTTGTGSRDYQLFFGPYWYEPTSGAKRPVDGQSMTITGGFNGNVHPPVIAVYDIDGHAWRDTTGPAPWYGGWVYRDITDTTFVHCWGDSLSFIGFPPGCMGTGMMGGGMMWPDSLYCGFMWAHPDSLPGLPPGDALMGFHVEQLNPMGSPMMTGGMHGHGMMGFMRGLRYTFHVPADSLTRWGLGLDQMVLKYYDTDHQWKTASGTVVDPLRNTITTSRSESYSFYAIVPSSVTSVEPVDGDVPMGFSLVQNYPNPFNPSTTVEFALPHAGFVTLKVYNVLGEEVGTLIAGNRAPGTFKATWDASGLPSGIYFYRLTAGEYVQTKKAVLMR